MNITVLDTNPADVGDMDWSPLAQHGELTLHEFTAPDDRIERITGANVVLTNKVRLDREVFEACPTLQFVGVLATGFDNIDVEAAAEHGVTVCNVPGYSTASTAQLTMTLLLQLAYRTGEHSRAVHEGRWSGASSYSFWDFPLVELDGKSLLVVGLGAIGSRTAAIAEAVGMKVRSAQLPGRRPSGGAYPRVPLEQGLAEADAVCLHTPLTDETRGLLNRERFALMKPTSFVVNAGRGPLIDSAAAREALETGTIAGLATDVLEQEPPPLDHPLIGAPNCIITPHVGWASAEARTRLVGAAIQNVACYLAGEPQNVVAAPAS